jgi:hypothetical protein
MNGDEANVPEGRDEHRDRHGADGGQAHFSLSSRMGRIGAVIDVMTQIMAHQLCMVGVSSEHPCSHAGHQRIDCPHDKIEDVDRLDLRKHSCVMMTLPRSNFLSRLGVGRGSSGQEDNGVC